MATITLGIVATSIQNIIIFKVEINLTRKFK